MANHERAKIDPNMDERVFDGGEDDDDSDGSHLPVVIIIAILVLAAFGGVVWLAYNQGVARGRSDVPVRMAAAQAKNDDGGIKVYQEPAGTEEGDESKTPKTTAAPAVTPTTPAQTQGTQTQTVQAPAPMAPVQAAPVQPAPKTDAQAPAQPPVAVPKPVTAKPQPVTTAAAKPYTQPATQEPAPPLAATAPPAQLGAAHLTTQTPAATPAPKTVAAAKPEPLKSATLKPVAEPPAKPATTAKADTIPKPVAVAKADAPPKPAASAGSYLLQIGAYKSEEEARAAWKAYQSKHATLLSGFNADVQRTSHDDGSIWYRLRIASFSDKDAATAVCDRLKAQGGACFLAK